MADVRIVPAEPAHVEVLGLWLRLEDVAEGRALGLEPMEGARRSFRHSMVARTGLVNGRVGAMWGVVGMALGQLGQPWLLTGPACRLISPLLFARIYRQEALAMLDFFPRLENYVDASYGAAVRMLRLAGFWVDEPMPYGAKGALFRRFGMGE